MSTKNKRSSFKKFFDSPLWKAAVVATVMYFTMGAGGSAAAPASGAAGGAGGVAGAAGEAGAALGAGEAVGGATAATNLAGAGAGTGTATGIIGGSIAPTATTAATTTATTAAASAPWWKTATTFIKDNPMAANMMFNAVGSMVSPDEQDLAEQRKQDEKELMAEQERIRRSRWSDMSVPSSVGMSGSGRPLYYQDGRPVHGAQGIINRGM